MNCRSLTQGIVLFGLLLTSWAGEAAPGRVSRSCAPLGAQESITVDWTFASRWYWTASQHYRNGILLHVPNSGWANTWRSYAGHFGSEFWYGFVQGFHYDWDPRWGGRFLGGSIASDCNLGQWGF